MSLKVGSLKAEPGEHVFGMLEVARSRSGLSPEIPVHLFAGVEDGPTFLVQPTIHGNESVGNLRLLRWTYALAGVSAIIALVVALPLGVLYGLVAGFSGR